ncbi:hypothetical protein SLS53_005968 [Cytospora paraplurivora]|uniref:Major facilitator superfamily (MFS) profile domain-containing protein n=1 Tax=Cytospora paraplurivora TaxID=2898453 RepID=A0AAN9U4A2_9PEZI
MSPPTPKQQTNIASLPTISKNDAGITPAKRVLPADEVELAKDCQNYENVDRELAQYVSDTRVEITPEKNAELLRKIDRRVLAVMVTTYFLQAIDKGTLSFASIMGITEDTHLTGQDYSWLTTCIYITILIVEYPQNWIIARVPIAKYLSFSIVAWGAVLACTAACHDFAGLVTVRTLLGLFESACQPCFLLLSSIWYRRSEQLSRTVFYYMTNGVQQMVGGLLAYCFTLITTGPLKSWQWIFLVYGILSVFFGLFVGCYMPDSPMRARCFSEEDKHLLVERVRENQTGVQNRTFKKYQIIEALRDPQVWGYAIIALTTTLPTSGLGAFQGIVIKSFGFTTLQTQLAQTLSLSMISRNVAGQTKKSAAIAINFICWAAGNAIGPQVFIKRDAPRYFTAFATHLGCYCLLVVDIILLRWYLTTQNKKRDRLAVEGIREAHDTAFIHAFEDKTDSENPNFRYVY